VLILRDYQTADVVAIRAAFAQHRRVLHVLPTGGGKTIEFAYVVAHAAAKGNCVVVLGHRQEIADQISLALAAMDVAHGRIQPGYGMTTDLVQVGMVQTVAWPSRNWSRSGASNGTWMPRVGGSSVMHDR
jgi:superfamily II DNA or RNA helicase